MGAAIRQRMPQILVLLLGIAGFFLTIGGDASPASAQTCGGRGQPTCTRETVVDGCWGPGEICYIEVEVCEAGLRVDSGHNCALIGGQPLAVPRPVNFPDGNRTVTAGYATTVDLTQQEEMISAGSHPVICNWSADKSSDKQPLMPNPSAETGEDPWVVQPDYSPRLAVNGSFFELYSGDVWVFECTHPMGYTVSKGINVRPEEKIKVYSMPGGSRLFAPGTLLFYANNRPQGRAEIKWYPFSNGNSGAVPPGVINAISGIPLVRDGAFVPDTGPDATQVDSRTALGLTADGNHLIVVVVNGGSPAEGTTLQGLAQYMIGLGARNAINLDGGGSASLYYNSDNFIVRSKPSQSKRGIAGLFYRPVVNFIGFK